MLGHTINFGFMEAITLLSSKIYSEKQIGYMAVSLFLSGNNDLLPLVVNSLKNDLNDENPDYNCLALQCIATLGNETWAEILTEDVFQILRSPTTETLPRKKASLALLKLLQISPHIITEKHPSWIPRIIACIDDKDLGFVTSITSLVQFIAKVSPESCRLSIPTATRRLSKLIIDENCESDYFYYDVPAPWLTVKLLSLIEYLVPDASTADIDNITLSNLKEIINTVIEKSVTKKNSQYSNSQQYKNAQSAILFSVIALGAHLDASTDASMNAIRALGYLLDSPETNTRYLALDALIKVAARGGNPAIKCAYDHLKKILDSLKDKDISIRRKAIDLLYTLCDSSSVENICNELLKYIEVADYQMRSDVAVKAAVLAEKYATDATWYVSTILKLISLAGNHMTDEVWERIIQIAVNNESLQPTTCRAVVRHLRNNLFPESMMKVSSFVLGEYGYRIEASVSPQEQFEILYDKYFYCSLITRAMLLSCFLKFFIRYEFLRPQVMDLFQLETKSLDSEIQQRAIEYLKLVTMDDNLVFVKQVVQELPPFQNDVSPLIARLGSVKDVTTAMIKPIKPPAPPPPRAKRASSSAVPQLSQRPSRASTFSGSDNSSVNPFDSAFINGDQNKLTPHWEEGFYRALHFDQGIFFENSLMRIIYRCRTDKNNLVFQLTYFNKSPVDITALTVDVKSNTSTSEPSYILSTLELPASDIKVHGKSTHSFEASLRNIYESKEAPMLTVSFMAGSFVQLYLKLPILLIKTLSPAPSSSPQDFFKRWQQLSALGADGESQRIFSISHRHSDESLLRVVNRLGFNIVENADSNSRNIVGAGILHTVKGNHGCLLRLEPDEEGRQFRITIRATGPGIAKVLADTIIELFEFGF
ncbi:hypothetical protein PACTADRAFT_51733 [Pachysolen tannophilus NRRL Y-2460]|uniref:AP-2 complex subunit alpha n=1 Tax=Pachysolen tannophilus NRRL Y-2460 TaxID=669874 RepID=A0A1E4TQF3_PACTA|nr:hypothetical protein PACTADRAFT_51733 [Pachysolen tannophilus NRRL Y-2460]